MITGRSVATCRQRSTQDLPPTSARHPFAGTPEDSAEPFTSLQGTNAPLWHGATSVLVPMGATSEDLRYLKSLAFHLWLLGYELPGKQRQTRFSTLAAFARLFTATLGTAAACRARTA